MGIINSLNTELTIAIIGAITGISSLLLQFFSYLYLKASLKIEYDDWTSSFYFNTKSFDGTISVNDKENNSAAISVRLVNRSSEPITIYKVSFKSRSNFDIHRDFFKFTPAKIHMDSGRTTSLNIANQFDLPITIDPYSVINGSINCLYADQFIKNKKFVAKLIFQTSRKSFRF
ncbi:hypothetical protein KXK16_002753, partial [Listeria monocytogenes]|nr:hypothetical protein [Listeria monocytogenes]